MRILSKKAIIALTLDQLTCPANAKGTTRRLGLFFTSSDGRDGNQRRRSSSELVERCDRFIRLTDVAVGFVDDTVAEVAA